MALDSLAMTISALPTGLSAAGRSASTASTHFAQALASVSSPSVAGVHGTPGQTVREVQGGRAKGGSGFGLGQEILNSLEQLHRNDRGLKRPAVGALPVSGPQALAPSATLAPGPAAAPPSAGAARPNTTAVPSSAPEASDFGAMMREFEQVYTHAIQVSVVTKTTGSFTSSMNKLMSSA